MHNESLRQWTQALIAEINSLSRITSASLPKKGVVRLIAFVLQAQRKSGRWSNLLIVIVDVE
jgi:hypothetical protein